MATTETYKQQLLDTFAAKAPDLAVGPGTSIYNLFIVPVSEHLAANENDLQTVIDSISLSNLANDTSANAVQNLNLMMANMGLTRKTGTTAFGYIGLEITGSEDLFIPAHTAFVAGGVNLVLADSYTAKLTPVDDTDRQLIAMQNDTHYFTLPVVTETATTISIAIGEPATTDTVFTRVNSIYVVSTVTNGSADETQAEFAGRFMEGLAAKVPSGQAHIQAMLANSGLPYQSSYVAGMGDSEMLRDRYSFMPTSMGGCADVWVRTSSYPAITEYMATGTNTNGTWSVEIPASVAPGFYGVAYISNAGNKKLITGDISVSSIFWGSGNFRGPLNNYGYRYSIYQAATLTFEFEGAASDQFTIGLYVQPGIAELQQYIEAVDVRSKTQNILIRAAVPLFVSAALRVRCNSATTTATADTLATLVSDFINKTAVGYIKLSVGDLAVAITTAYPELTLEMPAIFNLMTYMPDGTIKHITDTDGEINSPTDSVQGVSANNAAFFSLAENISINLVYTK